MEEAAPIRVRDLNPEDQFEAYMRLFSEPGKGRLFDIQGIVAAAVEYSVRLLAPPFLTFERSLAAMKANDEGQVEGLNWWVGNGDACTGFTLDFPDGGGAWVFVLDHRVPPKDPDGPQDLVTPRRISCYELISPRNEWGGPCYLTDPHPNDVFSIDVPAAEDEGRLVLPGRAKIEDGGAAVLALRAVAARMNELGCDELIAARRAWGGQWVTEFQGPQRERLLAALGVSMLHDEGVAPGDKIAHGLMYLQAISTAADLWNDAEDLAKLILGLTTKNHDSYETRFVSADGVQEAYLMPEARGSVVALKCFETAWVLVLHQNSIEEMPHLLEIHCSEGIGGELRADDETRVAEIGLSPQGFTSKMIVPYSSQAMQELTGALGTISDLGAEVMGEPEARAEAAYLC